MEVERALGVAVTEVDMQCRPRERAKDRLVLGAESWGKTSQLVGVKGKTIKVGGGKRESRDARIESELEASGKSGEAETKTFWLYALNSAVATS